MNLSKRFWEKAYLDYAPKMKGVCRRYVSDLEVAEDLMHDAFLTAINKQDTFKGKGCFEAWLRRITVNTVLMYLRKKDSEKFVDDQLLIENKSQYMEEVNAITVRAVIEQADFTDTDLLAVVEKLPEHHRRVFNLYVIDHYTHVQIGKELNISAGTSKSHLARARKKIQQLLYTKAMENRNEQKKRKRAAMVLFILPWKSHYIDGLFKNRFANFSIETVSKSNVFFDSVNWDKVSLPMVKTGFWGTGICNGLLVTTGGVIITSFVIYNNMNSSNVAPVIDSLQLNKKIELIEVNDTCYTETTNTDTINVKSEIEEQNNPPVVVKRKIIQRKTLIIRDTINIIDSSYAK